MAIPQGGSGSAHSVPPQQPQQVAAHKSAATPSGSAATKAAAVAHSHLQHAPQPPAQKDKSALGYMNTVAEAMAGMNELLQKANAEKAEAVRQRDQYMAKAKELEATLGVFLDVISSPEKYQAVCAHMKHENEERNARSAWNGISREKSLQIFALRDYISSQASAAAPPPKVKGSDPLPAAGSEELDIYG